MRSTTAVVALLLAWAAAAAIIAALLLDARESALERAERTADAMTQVQEENTARTFQAIDFALLAIAELVEREPALVKNDLEFRRLLKERLSELPYVRALAVVDADGTILHDTDYPRTRDLSLAGQRYYAAHLEDPRLVRHIGLPQRGRGGLDWFLAVSRRIGPPGTAFRGIVVAAVQPLWFESLYRRTNLGRWEVMTLYHRDGTLVARVPADDASIGRSFALTDLFTALLPHAESGRYQTSDALVGYRAVEGLPLVVSFSQDSAAMLDEWRKTAVATLLAMLVLSAVLAYLAGDHVRRRWRREQERERNAQAEKMEAIGLLTGGIAHDFGNLLNIVSTNLHIMQMLPPDEARTAEAVKTARRAVTRGGELIARLLAFAKRQPLSLQAADLNAVVREAYGLLTHAAGARIQLTLDTAPRLGLCMLDRVQLEVALINLVVNARQAMDGQGRIVLRTYEAPRHVCLMVQDSGPGMSERVRRRAFEPFFTTRGNLGTGLGLPQVYGFMHQIGGNAHIESAPGEGTAVHLSFAKAPAAAAGAALGAFQPKM